MKILVMGAGAMGTAVGGFMARAGHDVVLVGRQAHVEVIHERGLHITGIWGDHQLPPQPAFTNLAAMPDKAFDLVVVAVKSYDTSAAVRELQPYIDSDTLLCAYQNGLGNAEMLADAVGWERVLGARVIFGARINRPGEVEITVIAEPTAIGAYHNAVPETRARTVAEAMDASGIPTVYTDRIETILWSKVAYNCALNPLSALLDVPYGELEKHDYTRKAMADIIHELYAVGAAMNIPLEPVTAEAYLQRFYEKLLPPTAAHYASMREDLIKGRRTEIDALNGRIARLGEDHNISCPANGLLAALIRAREKTADKEAG